MKSINQIFKNDKNLLANHSVKKLIDYCQELENEVIDNKQSSTSIIENKLSELVRDIYSSINNTIQEDENAKRFGEIDRVDYEEALKNLKRYLIRFSIDNNFKL